MANAILFKLLVSDKPESPCRVIQVISKSLDSARLTYNSKAEGGHILSVEDASLAKNSHFGRKETAEFLIDRTCK
jgi:hypothetical protein